MYEIGKTKEDVIQNIEAMYLKNPAVADLIQRFKLNWKSSPVIDEELTDTELINHLNNLKLNQMSKTENNSKAKKESKFTNEVEASAMRPFLKFKEVGDTIEGFLIGKQTITNKEKTTEHFILKNEDGEGLLPENVQLVNKLNNLLKIKGGDFGKDGIEVQISFTGEEKIDGSINKVKTFKVLTT